MPLLDQVVEKNPKTVKLVHKNFPLRNHKFAKRAAVASLAAHEQGKFWAYQDKIYENFRQLNEEKLQEFARDLALDMKKFASAMKNPSILAQVNKDVQDGVKAGVRGTPTIFVNGKLLRDRSLEGFQSAINSALEKEPSR